MNGIQCCVVGVSDMYVVVPNKVTCVTIKRVLIMSFSIAKTCAFTNRNELHCKQCDKICQKVTECEQRMGNV